MRPGFRTLSLTVSLAACSALAGCGDASRPPALARSDAAPLVRLADRVAEDTPCAQRRDIRRLEQQTAALVRTGRVPAAIQQPLLAGVSSLAADSPPCLSAVPAAATPPPPAVTSAPPPPAQHHAPPHGHHPHGHGGGHGHGKEEH